MYGSNHLRKERRRRGGKGGPGEGRREEVEDLCGTL
jgi:hypothetical protein